MGVTTNDQGKAQEIARKLMTGWGVDDLENLMTEQIPEKERRKLLAQIEPEYDAMEKEAIAIQDNLYKHFQKQEDKDALGRYVEIGLEMLGAEQKAGFHLGFAAALELLRVDGRGIAERKAQHMKGGRS